MNFEERVLQFIEKNKLMAPRQLIVVGVSGGADSMALLLALTALRHHLGIRLHVAHFNHRIRPSALNDERFVSDWCKWLNLPFTSARRKGKSLLHLSEDMARQMRFDFFKKTVQNLGAEGVALAHTKNDLAETVLMRMMRGSGLYGLRAILPGRMIQGVMFLHPLMGQTRFDVEKYLKEKKVPFCTDETNRLKIYERNKVRRSLLPYLAREYNPQIVNVLSDLAFIAADDYDFLASCVQKVSKKHMVISPKKAKMKLKGVKNLHPAILRLMLRGMVEGLTTDAAALHFEHIHALENMVKQKDYTAVDLPLGLKAFKSSNFFELSV
ncbi:MAG: tRNA lysidine(34) synthetase TilS [Candidatus Omnitrophica bacterium]|nr:tRNA lysidine(34) synthetase TilS [Candidatus Omnitrophota bacterium]